MRVKEDLLRNGFPVDALLSGQIFHDTVAGDDADEFVFVIHDGDEVLHQCILQKLFHVGGNAGCGKLLCLHDLGESDIFKVAQTNGSVIAFLDDVPKEITLARDAYIGAVPLDDRDGSVAGAAHLFKTLPQSAVMVQKSDIVFRCQEKSCVHGETHSSFLYVHHNR